MDGDVKKCFGSLEWYIYIKQCDHHHHMMVCCDDDDEREACESV